MKPKSSKAHSAFHVKVGYLTHSSITTTKIATLVLSHPSRFTHLTSLSISSISMRSHSPIALPTSLHIIAIDSRRRKILVLALLRLLLAEVIDVFKVEGVNMSREVTKNS